MDELFVCPRTHTHTHTHTRTHARLHARTRAHTHTHTHTHIHTHTHTRSLFFASAHFLGEEQDYEYKSKRNSISSTRGTTKAHIDKDLSYRLSHRISVLSFPHALSRDIRLLCASLKQRWNWSVYTRENCCIVSAFSRVFVFLTQKAAFVCSLSLLAVTVPVMKKPRTRRDIQSLCLFSF